MKQALVITPEGEMSKIDIATDALEKLQGAVDGWVQAVDLDSEFTMWCNEEGKIIGLERSPFAQYMWDKVFGAGTDLIVGTVVITGGTDNDGETIGLTDDQVSLLGLKNI